MSADWSMPIDATRPIYAQIVHGLVGRISRGEIRPGAGLPSVRALAQRIRVNPNTVQRAYRDMEAMGVAESHPGQGTFVCADPGALRRARDGAARQAAERAVAELRGLGLDAADIEDCIRHALAIEGAKW